MNSGDWVESLTALVEEQNGNWKIVHYKDWLQDHLLEKKKSKSINELLTKEVPVNESY
jgi:hypothetical protein